MFHHVEYPERIVHISDEDFFAALDLGVAGMEAVGSEIKAGNADAAFQSLWQHFLDRDAPVNPFVSDRDALAGQFIANRDLADTILNGGTWQFGQVVIDFSKPIAFDADFGDQSKYGFHYLNWLECVPHAALETGNADYIAKYLEIIRHWWTIRDKVTGARPMSPVFYELGLGGRSKRFIDFMYCLKALDLGHLLAIDDIRILFKSLLGAGRWLQLEQTTRGYRNGNWQLHGVRAILLIGFLFPEFSEAVEFRAVAGDIIEQHMERDYYEDGGHSERCYSYGSGCLRHLEEAVLLADANPDLAPTMHRDWREMTSRAHRWFLQMAGPGGAQPGINDGGFGSLAKLLRSGARFTKDPTFLWPVRHDLEAGDPEPREPDFKSLLLEPSEFAVMRNGWEPDDGFLLMNYGQWPGGHSHMGLLDFNLYWHGVPLAAELSRFGAYDVPWDMNFRSEQAHNHIVVEGAVSARPEVRGEDVRFGTTPRCDFFSARHRAYEKSAGVVIERRVLFLKPWGFLVSDAASCTLRRRSYLWYLHSPFEFQKGDTYAVASDGGPSLMVVPESAKQLRFAHTGIDYLAEMAEEVPTYGGQKSGPAWPDRHFLALRGWNIQHAVTPFDVLLLPYEGAQPEASVVGLPCKVSGDIPGDFKPRALKLQAEDETVVVIHSQPGITVETGNVRFSGHTAVIGYEGGRAAWAFVQDGERLDVGGAAVPLTGQGGEEVGL